MYFLLNISWIETGRPKTITFHTLIATKPPNPKESNLRSRSSTVITHLMMISNTMIKFFTMMKNLNLFLKRRWEKGYTSFKLL